MSNVKQIQMPHSFFKKSKQEYRDWRYAMIREIIQNSYDAKAKNISFVVREEQGIITLTCEDDGIGMNRDTLENVLLCLGGSQKLDGAIGGKGWAKQILFFAHRSYTIHSRDNIVIGSGGSYEISQAVDKQGTSIAVDLDDEDAEVDDWYFLIRKYASTCFMEYSTGRGVNIILDGEMLEQNVHEYQVNMEHELGSVWYNELKGWNRSSFVVSVSGLPMFVETIFSDSDESALEGGVELKAGGAALTANRDGFCGEIGDQFTQLICGLVQDQSSVRFGRAMELSINFDSMTCLPDAGLAEGDSNVSKCVLSSVADDLPDASDVYAKMLGRIDRAHYPRNFHFKVESLAARRTVKNEAHITVSALVEELNKHRSARLARSWRAAVSTILNCDWALANGVECYDGFGSAVIDWDDFNGDTLDLQTFFQGRRIDVGFCFIADTEGLCSTVVEGDYPHRIFINPMLLTEETAYRAGDMLDVAYHEVTHLWERYHGEAFCRVEGKLRQSVRRWISEREVIARIANAQTL